MEEHYMSMIWRVIGAKENEALTNSEKQSKIVAILSLMKQEAFDFQKQTLKKQCIKAATDSINAL